jgi:hypothetical protein
VPNSQFLRVRPTFLKLYSAKGCQAFRDAKMRNGRRVLLAVLNLYVPIRITASTLDTNHSVADSKQIINRCINPEASRFCSHVSEHSSSIDSRCVRRNYQVIGRFEVSR